MKIFFQLFLNLNMLILKNGLLLTQFLFFITLIWFMEQFPNTVQLRLVPWCKDLAKQTTYGLKSEARNWSVQPLNTSITSWHFVRSPSVIKNYFQLNMQVCSRRTLRLKWNEFIVFFSMLSHIFTLRIQFDFFIFRCIIISTLSFVISFLSRHVISC